MQKVIRHWRIYNRLSFSLAQVNIGIRNINEVNGSCYILLIVTGITFSPGQGCAGGIIRHGECDEGSRSETQNAEREAERKARSRAGESE